MEKALSQLVEKLTRAYGSKIVSVVLYGSGADGELHGKYSDLNVLCVLTQLTSVELAASGGVFRWWREQGSPAPLLMSEHEVARSTDSFPIEFKDMKASRKVLAGRDVIAALEISDHNYRTQLEHELRAKLLRLRQKAAGMWEADDMLRELMLDSVSTFLVLARHALAVSGEPVEWKKRATVAACQKRFNIDPEPFYTLLDLREGSIKKLPVAATELFERYRAQIETLVEAVDQLEK